VVTRAAGEGLTSALLVRLKLAQATQLRPLPCLCNTGLLGAVLHHTVVDVRLRVCAVVLV
jgi:hypothetical protein